MHVAAIGGDKQQDEAVIRSRPLVAMGTERPRSQRPGQVSRLPRSLSQHPRRIFGWNPDLTVRRSLSIPWRAAMLAITRATTHGGTGVAMPTTVTTPWRPPRPAWPAASPIWARLPLIHSIASRTTAPALSIGRIGFEARAPQVAFRLESVIWERRNAAGDYRESVCRRRRCECRLRPASDA